MATRRSNLRVFLDTNVIFSGLYSSHGAPGSILECFTRGTVSVVISQMVLDESVRIVKEKLPEGLGSLRRLLRSAPIEIQIDPPVDEIRKWSDKVPFVDAIILAAAINAKVDYFITGDSHFFTSSNIRDASGLKIVTPSQFISIIKNNG